MVKNAAAVVTVVKNMGINNESMVVATAFLTSLLSRISLKNLATTCTPSELAIVNNIMGMDVFTMVNKKRSEPVSL